MHYNAVRVRRSYTIRRSEAPPAPDVPADLNHSDTCSIVGKRRRSGVRIGI